MQRIVILFLAFSLSACATQAGLQRVLYEKPALQIILDKGAIPGSPHFSAPYDHPASISPDRLKKVLEKVQVQAPKSLLSGLLSRGKKKKPAFDAKNTRDLAVQLSQALSEAGASERVRFYQIIPKNKVNDEVTAGYILVKDERLHLRLDLHKFPHRIGTSLSSLGRGLPRTEKVRYGFALSEGDGMTYRSYKNTFGLTGSDARWLVIDYQAVSSRPEKTGPALSETPTMTPETLEDKLRTLKHLRKEDLISEEEYILKKNFLLKDF